MKEPFRYLQKAKALLRKSPIEDNYYTDVKYVKSACGELPKKVEEFEKALKKHASAHNGKPAKEFDFLYDELHIAGYYRGLLLGRFR